jgi:hypothetical protein
MTQLNNMSVVMLCRKLFILMLNVFEGSVIMLSVVRPNVVRPNVVRPNVLAPATDVMKKR